MSAAIVLLIALAGALRTAPEGAAAQALAAEARGGAGFTPAESRGGPGGVRRSTYALDEDPQAAVEHARRALAASAEFLPTDFVRPGRKGEVVEDAYRAARDTYRRQRAVLYRALGEAQLAAGQSVSAGRYLSRAELLDEGAGAWPALIAARLGAGRPAEAVAILLGRAKGALSSENRALAERAADAAGLPSLQAELDRARLLALPESQRPRLLASPLVAPERSRLSTGAPLRLDQPGLTLVYVADAGCQSCSADLLALERRLPAGASVYVTAADPSQDRALRQALRAYRYDWPVVVGARLATAFDLQPPALLVVARSGFSALTLAPPLEQRLAPVLAVLAREDLQEALPRPAWNRRPVTRGAPAAPPGLSPEGLAQGEDEAMPGDFVAGLAAYRTGRYAEALRLFEAAAGDDGWLLPPEARFDRALCLAALGRRDEARRMLLRIGDSRFQDAVDEALERVAAGP